MNFNIKLSINKRQDSHHNTFLLRWNPAISSYTMKRLNNDIEEWHSGYWDCDFDWSVYDWKEAQCGDRFFMIRVGKGNIGLFAAGRFTSDPTQGEDWAKKGRDTYYMQMEFEAVFHPDRTSIITTEVLERELPNINWRQGHSGELIDNSTAEKLEVMWRLHNERNKNAFLPCAAKNEDYDSRSDIDKAIEFASKAHAADYDFDGNPTILHPIAVGMMGTTDNERIVGFLHDVVEDTKYTFDDLIEEGFSEEIISALRLLTHDKQTPYMDYIKQICESGNQTAINVKINDLKHNLARGEAGGHTQCVEKHTVALAYIESYLAEHPNDKEPSNEVTCLV